MQQIELAFFIEIAGKNQLSRFAKFRHPCGIARSKLFFELLANFLSQRWTLPGSGNRDLKIATAHHGRIEEIAEIRNIHHIAQDAASLSFGIDALVERARIRRHHGEKRAVQIVGRKGAKLEFDLSGARPFAYRRTRFERYDADARTGFEQAANFWLPNLARADHQAPPSLPASGTWEIS